MRRTFTDISHLQIGLLEPKYLPTGPQTEKALKAVRFPTQKTAESSQSNGPVTKAIKAKQAKNSKAIGANITSPVDPNAA